MGRRLGLEAILAEPEVDDGLVGEEAVDEGGEALVLDVGVVEVEQLQLAPRRRERRRLWRDGKARRRDWVARRAADDDWIGLDPPIGSEVRTRVERDSEAIRTGIRSVPCQMDRSTRSNSINRCNRITARATV